MEIQSAGIELQGDQVVSKDDDALTNIDLQEFLELFIAELQNQDPLEPMDNSEMLAQISQIREIGATDSLTSTLEAVQLGQSLSTAGGLIGKEVRALTSASSDGEQQFVEGTVDKVSINDGKPTLYIDGQQVSLENVAEILPSSS
ncbi:MAG: flagellar biosynthesis protein FlgD [Pirellulales bacterium]|nr:flagellar biosynthesis protein FlgD [Pirellulales bacterium]